MSKALSMPTQTDTNTTPPSQSKAAISNTFSIISFSPCLLPYGAMTAQRTQVLLAQGEGALRAQAWVPVLPLLAQLSELSRVWAQ
jgi:hypothetical protein